MAALDLSRAVNALNCVIYGKAGTHLSPRFGYVQLGSFLTALEDRIKNDRKQGMIWLEHGRVNTSVAIDMYLGAQNGGPDYPSTRNRI
jgi:hypothetical protein